MKASNSTGFDEIPSKLLKSISSELAPPLSYLINLSMKSGNCPTLLKSSIIKSFLYVKKNEEKNYRSITLLSSLSKIFETVMLKNLSSFL